MFMQSSVPGKNSLAPLDDDALQDAETPGTVSNDADNCLNAPGADRVMVVLKVKFHVVHNIRKTEPN